MHMLLINFTAIQQGNIPIHKHTQSMAHTMSRLYLRDTLTGELDTHIENIITELTSMTNRKAMPPSTQSTTIHPNSRPKNTTSTIPTSNKRPHNETLQEIDATINTTTDPKRMKLRYPHPQTNNTYYLDTNSTPPLRHILKPPLHKSTRSKQPLKRTRRRTDHANNTQLRINQCKG